jgi:hypothetical protein
MAILITDKLTAGDGNVHPLLDDEHLLGGLRIKNSLQEMYDISLNKRKEGMLVKCLENNLIYSLKSQPWSFDNNDWNVLNTVSYDKMYFSSFNLAGINNKKVGDIISGTVEFSWNIENSSFLQPNSIEISGYNIPTIPNLSNTGSLDIVLLNDVTRDTEGVRTWQISAKSLDGKTISTTFNLRWDWLSYWGNSLLENLNESQIKTLNSELINNSIKKEYIFTNNNYFYIILPSNIYETPKAFINSKTNFRVQMTELGLINITDNSIIKNYKIYRTKYPLDDIININII